MVTEISALGDDDLQLLQDRDGDARDDNVTTWLPRDLQPLHYRVAIQPVLQEGNFTAPGELEFTFRARAATDRVVINVRDLAVDEASVAVEEEGPSGTWRSVGVLRHEYNASMETYAAVLQAALRPGRATKYRLKMKYVGGVRDDLKGLYALTYPGENNAKRYMALTQLHPTNARTMFPCLDEPQHKARFTLAVARRPEHTVVANMPLRASEPRADGWVWDHFHTSVPMSTYLIALAVFDFKFLQLTGERVTQHDRVPVADAVTRDVSVAFRNASRDSSRDVTTRVWARPGLLHRGEYAARIGPRVLRFFSDMFNISFPLPKQDLVAAPKLMFSAMENWGLITFREDSLLVDEANTGSRHLVATTVAHELAHQWFGNLVTMTWWNDVWLNEGFATFMSQLGVSHVEPGWRSEGVFVLENMQGVMQDDALPSSHAVSREVYRVGDIDNIFDAISYKKGSSLVRMMSAFLGADAFQRGLNAYLRRHAYANAAQDDLWAALTEAARTARRPGGARLPPGQSVKSIMDSWTLRTGFPVVDVVRDYCRGTANVTQRRFLVATASSVTTATSTTTATTGSPSAQDADAEDCCWGVPLWLKTPRNLFRPSKPTETLQWLQTRGAEVAGLPGSAQWVLANGARAGFYRVNYDAANWRLLTEGLDDLSDLERAGLVDDALALADAGLLAYEVPLGLLQRLPRTEPSLAWVAALSWLAKISHLLHGTHGANGAQGSSSAFSRWARGVAADLLRVSSSAAVRASTDPVDHAFVTRVRRWACGLGVPECLGQHAPHAPAARLVFNETDICEGSTRTPEEWSSLLTKVSKEDSNLYLKLAECIQSSSAARRMMEMTFMEDENDQMVSDLLVRLSANPHSYDTLMQFLTENLTPLLDRHGNGLSYDFVKSTAPFVKNDDHQNKMKKIFLKSNLNDLSHRAEQGAHNIWWIENQAEHVLKAVQVFVQ
ncbi:thyrotropin-releasing hormone-degrading ectoenzyme-like [Thrips palmi]|uniref:Aminopeptidase n=1 Tax=Thrips palmi TaxID=161013 RepID=A0A6P8Z125_THRPL|nr:thyrotropin-releasing hormone-degrading ectoenzyme-like [Thrips palmi]